MSIHEEQTLHDFVLNLLNDTAARSAFAQDPTHALECAGLGDITAQDVQEVVPLVMDFGQLPSADSLGGGLGDLPAGAEGIEGAIAQLRSVADAAGEQRSDSGLGDLGGFDLDAEGSGDGLTGTAEVFSEQFEGVGGIGASQDGGAAATALTSEAGELAGAGSAGLEGVTGSLAWAGEASGAGELTGEATADGVHLGSSSDSAAGHFAAVGGGGLEGSSGGGASYEGALGSGSGTLDAGMEGATGELGFDSEQGSLAGFGAASTDGATGGVALGSDELSLEGSAAGKADALAAGGSVNSPFGAYGVEMSGAPETPAAPELCTTGDLAGALDSEALGRGSESAASTLATYMTSNGAALGGLAPVDVPAAPQLPDTGSLPVDVPAKLPTEQLPADLPTELPDPARSLPAETGELPVDVPTDVPANLPADDLPADLPAELPELPVANPLPAPQDVRSEVEQGVQDNPVTDAVGSSPLGDVAGHLPTPDQAPSVGDVDLGGL
ncbi:IniB N-terminal domain-containing protein [Prauserella muralis]|uniref:Uncharacterized protein n=1 Tax=Prauserella muralis TaxID=588067 RepID=A0A2V4B7R6_9PSEU|nr:IniB N-terminal domain-containing protein [Prauserella muralis]PXY31290.1 hypothetical protein BAY60_02490 [Prauserella muralis]TWE14399.1 hypothetical protein FHX69_6545 [Prauserella muralis]